MHKNPKESKHKHVPSKETNTTSSFVQWCPDESPTNKTQHKKPIEFCRKMLFNKYFEAFNFYFSKHINEIIADLPVSHVILYKDYLYYDEEEEFLRRYYSLDETPSRLQNLCKFYSNVEGNMNKPNLGVHAQNGIILKRNERLHELYVGRLKNFHTMPKTHREHEKPVDFQVLKADDHTGYYEESPSESLGIKRDSNLPIPEEKLHTSFQKMLEAHEDMDKVSYESSQHDVYNPSPASSRAEPINRSVEKSNGKVNIEDFEHKPAVYVTDLLDESLSAIGGIDPRPSNTLDIDEVEQMSSLCLSNASDITLIQKMFGGPNENNPAGEVPKDGRKKNVIDSIPKHMKNKVKGKDLKVTIKKSEKEEEDVKKLSYGNKDSMSKSTATEEKPQKSFGESQQAQKQIINGQRLKTKGSRILERKVERTYTATKVEPQEKNKPVSIDEYITTARTNPPLRTASIQQDTTTAASPTTPLQTIDSARKIEYWSVAGTKGTSATPLKIIKTNNRSDPEVKIEKSEEKIKPKNSSKSSQHAQHTIARPRLGAFLQIPINKEIEKIPEPPNVANNNNINPKKLIRITKEANGIKGASSTERSKVKSKSNKSRNLVEEKSESYYTKEEKKEIVGELPAKVKNAYKNNPLYLSVMDYHSRTSTFTRSRTDEKYHSLGKSATEEPQSGNPTHRSSKGEMHVTGTQPQKRRMITSSLKVLTSFNDQQHKSAGQNAVVKEGTTLGHLLLNGQVVKTQNSAEHFKTLQDNTTEEKIMTNGYNSSGAASKNLSVKNLHVHLKPPTKSSIPSVQSKSYSRADIYDYTAVVTRRTTGQIASIPSLPSGHGNGAVGIPVSPQKQFNLNINLKKLNSQESQETKDSIDNSYGFWTGRSSRGNVNDSGRKVRGSLKGSDDRYIYTEGKDYVATHKYNAPYTTEKSGGNTSRRFTKVSMYREFKLRENEMLRSIKNLKPDYMLSAWPPASADQVKTGKNEDNKGLLEAQKSLSSKSSKIKRANAK